MAVFNECSVIIDPMLPKEAAKALRSVPAELIPFGDPKPSAEPRGVKALLIPVIATEVTGIGVVALAIYRLGAYDIPSLHLQQVPYFLVIAAMLAGLMVMLAGTTGVRRWGGIRYERNAAANAIRYHRRYVFPDTDMDPETKVTWGRVVKATNTIHRSRAVRDHGGVDAVWVSTVLPHHRWDIAEGLARLSLLRKRQRDILASAGDQEAARERDIAAILIPQQRAQELATADIERHVRLLEDLASQVSAAETAIQRKRAARELTALDEQHDDLLARTGRQGTWYASDLEQASRDLRAIADEP